MRGLARRLVRALAFGLLRISRAFEGISRGLAVSTFTSAELDALSVSEWEAFGEQGPIMGDGPISWETGFFAKHIRPGDSVLVVGAGTGRDVFPLLAQGHVVTALDIAPRALQALREKASERGFAVSTVHASIVSAELPPSAFDVVLFSWFCFGYLRGEAHRRAALLRCAATLRPGGRVLLSYIEHRGATPSAAPGASIAWLAARLLGGTQIDPGDQFNLTGSAERPNVFFSHSFVARDLEGEVRSAGLNIAFHDQPTSGVGVLALTGEGSAAS